MNPNTANLETKLRQWQLASTSSDGDHAQRLSNEIYRIVFTRGEDAALWDERVIVGLERVLLTHPPHPDIYGEQANALLGRANKVRAINDAFFRFLDPEMTIHQAIEVTTACVDLPTHVKQRLRFDGGLAEIKKAPEAPSVKLWKFVQYIADALDGQRGPWLDEFHHCIEAIRDREGLGTANALLVQKQTNNGIVLTLTAGVQRGSGQVQFMTPATVTFVIAVDRARMALVGGGFLTQSHDVLLTVNLTEAEYEGGSIALAAAMAMHSSLSLRHLDPYTAFTGNLNFSSNSWIVQGVEGIREKLLAAVEAGIRRVLLPKENEPDVPEELHQRIRVIPVSNITEVLLHLLLPTDRLNGDSLETRKHQILQAACIEQGWHLSEPEPIQDGIQFTISPPTPPDLKVTIYKTGAHSPKHSDRPEFQQVLDMLSSLDTPSVPLGAVQEVFTVRDIDLRAQVREALEELSPAEVKNEPYCEYSFRFHEGKEGLVVKQYTSGKLQVQGYAGPLYRRVLEVIIPRYKVLYPNAALRVEEYLAQIGASAKTSKDTGTSLPEEVVPFPYIGTDESGKGDYFGPMVVAGVWLDESTQKQLEVLGVRDSKSLSDQKCRELAVRIRELCRGKYQEVIISPERYNGLYEQFQHERKNLNHLLAWGHARALESLLTRRPSQHAVADQFGDEKYIQSKLMEKGKTIQLVQTPKAERYTAVAAASVLARDCFLARLQQIGHQFGVSLPKGASRAVVDVARTIVEEGRGVEALRKVAKIHFKTTTRVMGHGEGK